MAGTEAVLAILPAGTANLLAANLKIPADLTEAVRVGLKGEPRRFDTGSLNGEHFAVMAGAGFDARMIKDAGRGQKGRFGRAAYLYAGARNLTWVASRSSMGRGRMTASSNSGWSPPGTRSSGPGLWYGWLRAGPRNRRS